MKQLRTRTLIFFWLLSPSGLWADGALTLNDCFQAALKRSEVLADQQELVAQAEMNYDRAWGNILPSVSASYLILARGGSQYRGGGNTSSSDVQQTLKLSADQPLFRGFRDFAALHAAKTFITEQNLSREWAALQLYRDVTQAFYTFLAVQKDLQLLDKELDQYQKRIDVIQQRIDIGRSRVTEILTLKTARAILRAQREQVLGQVDVAAEVLSFLTGLDPYVMLDDGDAPPANLEALENYQSKLSARPDVQAAQTNVGVFKSNVSIAKGERLPSADVLANLYAQRPDLTDNGVWDAALVITLPIFTGGIISSDIKIAKSQQQQSELALSRVQRLALEDIRALHHTLKSELAQTAALAEAFDTADKNYKANIKDYDHGLVTNLDVLQALVSYQDTERSLEKIRYVAKIDANRLEAATASRADLIGQQKAK